MFEINEYPRSDTHSYAGEDQAVSDLDLPEPLERWSEEDFGDLVPSWGRTS